MKSTDVAPPDVAARSSLEGEIATCRACRDAPHGRMLPHEPRPVVRLSQTARILIAGQAPGVRVHASGVPFSDPSGDRLRDWLGVSPDRFYDTDVFAIVPMGFCFPGQDARGGDLPPRRECRALWHDRVMAAMPHIDLVLAIGQHALVYHAARLGLARSTSLTAAVASWADFLPHGLFPMPHPSWRNSGWLKRNPWFARDLLPALRREIAARMP